MTVLRKISIKNEKQSFQYSIFIGDNYIQLLENNFLKTLKGKKIYVIYDEFFNKLKLNNNLIENSSYKKEKKLNIQLDNNELIKSTFSIILPETN